MRELGASGVEATVINISERGFMADRDGQFEVGTRVWLILPGGRERANAVIKWTAGDKIGAEFAEPVSIEATPRLTHRLVGRPSRPAAEPLSDPQESGRRLQPAPTSVVEPRAKGRTAMPITQRGLEALRAGLSRRLS